MIWIRGDLLGVEMEGVLCYVFDLVGLLLWKLWL